MDRIPVGYHTGMDWSCNQKVQGQQMEAPMVLVGEEQMRCTMGVFHPLFVYCVLEAWQLARFGMADFLLLAYCLVYLMLMERSNHSYSDMDTVVAADWWVQSHVSEA